MKLFKFTIAKNVGQPVSSSSQPSSSGSAANARDIVNEIETDAAGVASLLVKQLSKRKISFNCNDTLQLDIATPSGSPGAQRLPVSDPPPRKTRHKRYDCRTDSWEIVEEPSPAVTRMDSPQQLDNHVDVFQDDFVHHEFIGNDIENDVKLVGEVALNDLPHHSPQPGTSASVQVEPAGADGLDDGLEALVSRDRISSAAQLEIFDDKLYQLITDYTRLTQRKIVSAQKTFIHNSYFFHFFSSLTFNFRWLTFG